MYNAPPPNLMHGIRLVQAGHRAEALPYLRHAAQTEMLTAEGWLWLAAATDNLDEYRYCVEQALYLDAYHPVALRMRNALEAQTWGHAVPPAPAQPAYSQPSPFAVPVREQAPAPRRLSWPWRIARALVLALVLGGCIGISAALIASGAITNLVRDLWSVEAMHVLDFTIGDDADYRFRVEVPETWQPANTDNATWLATRADLAATFSEIRDVWDTLDESFSTVVRDPTYGTIMPLVRLVETDPEQLRAAGMVPALTLHEILPLPDPPPDTPNPDDVCTRMRALETEFVAGGGYAEIAGGAVLETPFEERSNLNDCVFYIVRRYDNLTPDQVPTALSAASAPDATREIVIAVPVGTVRYAVWQFIYPDRMHDDYDYAVERIVDTLVYMP